MGKKIPIGIKKGAKTYLNIITPPFLAYHFEISLGQAWRPRVAVSPSATALCSHREQLQI